MKCYLIYFLSAMSVLISSSDRMIAQPCPIVNSRVTTDGGPQGETAIAVNPLDCNKLMAGWGDFRSTVVIDGVTYRTFQPGFSFSTNGGVSWSAEAVIPITPHVTQVGDPSVAFDRYGYSYFCYGSQYDGYVHVSRSSDMVNFTV